MKIRIHGLTLLIVCCSSAARAGAPPPESIYLRKVPQALQQEVESLLDNIGRLHPVDDEQRQQIESLVPKLRDFSLDHTRTAGGETRRVSVHDAAIAELVRIGKKAVPILARYLTDERRSMRRWVLSVVKGISMGPGPSGPRTMPKHKEFAPLFLRSLRDRHEKVRRDAIRWLSRLNDNDIVAEIAAMRDDPSEKVRTYTYGESQNVLLLIKIVEDDILDRWREVYDVVDYGDE